MSNPLRKRSLLSEESLDAIEKAVADAEQQTSCEYIVVLAPASSRYEGRVIKAAALVALISFAVMYSVSLWMFGEPDALWLLIEALGVAGVSALLFARISVLRRALIPEWRRRDAVDQAAAATFFEENASLTKDRNAVLLYVSVLEGEARLLPDIGVQQQVHEGALGEIKARLVNAVDGDPTDLVCEVIRSLGNCCKECFPIAEDDENELPDRPQIREP